MIRNSRTISLSLVLCLGLAGCGPDASNNGGTNNQSTNNQSTNNQSTNNQSTNNGTTSTNNGTTSGGPSALVGFASTADFGEGVSAWVPVLQDDGGYRLGSAVSFGAGDVGLSVADGMVLALDRLGGVVQVLDPGLDGFDAGRIELGGELTNPHSATAVGGDVYVSLYDAGEVAVAGSVEGTWEELPRIDLSAYDEDGNPEPGAMVADGDHVLVVLQTLTDFAGVENSQLAVIDTQSGAVTTLDLGQKNCAGGLVAVPGGGFAVGCIGTYAVNDGAIVRIDSNAPGTYTIGEIIATEEDLGGDVIDFAMTAADAGIATVSLPDFTSKTVRLDATGVSALAASTDPGYAGLDVSETAWALGDRTQNAIVFTNSEGETVQTVSLEQPPAAFRFLR